MGVEPAKTGIGGAITEFASRGLLLYVALFLIEVALFFVVANLPFFPGEQSLYTSQSNQISNEFQGASLFTQFWGIFTNNLRIALLEMIPDSVPRCSDSLCTRRPGYLEVTAISDNVSPLLVLIVLLLLFPHSWIELPAYAVATGEGVYLLYAILRWLRGKGGGRSAANFGAEGWQFLINLIIVTVMLLLAALFRSG